METEVKLTKLAGCAGCGAKVGAGTLVHLLEGFRTHTDPRAKAFKQVYERSGTDLCAAAGAASKFGQLYFGLHRKISPFP